MAVNYETSAITASITETVGGETPLMLVLGVIPAVGRDDLMPDLMCSSTQKAILQVET